MQWTRNTKTPFHKAFAPLASEIQEVLKDYFGKNETNEDDAWFIVCGYRRFAYWGGAGFTEDYFPEKNGAPSWKQKKRDFLSAARIMQKAHKTVQKLCLDTGAAESLAWAIFENKSGKKGVLPLNMLLEKINAIDSLGKAIQKIHDEGDLLKSSWRDKDKMKRATIRDIANLFVIRYRKDSNNDPFKNKEFQKLLSDIFKCLEMECPDDKTIRNELKIWATDKL